MSEFQRVGLLGRREHPGVTHVVSELLDLLDGRGIDVVLEDRLATLAHFETRAMQPRDAIGANVDLAVVIGGDGSLLSAARTLVKHDCPVIGINRGRLGFLTDVSPDDGLVTHVSSVLDGHYTTDKRFLLDVEVHGPHGLTGQAEALNDVVVNSGTSAQMIEFQLHVDDEFVYRMNADGLIISTPTGSTAYSLSARGPIVSPQHRAILLTPVSPHMLFDRSLVLSPNEVVEIEVAGHRRADVAVDGQPRSILEPGDVVRCSPSAATANFVRFGAYRYHQILKSKFGLSDR